MPLDEAPGHARSATAMQMTPGSPNAAPPRAATPLVVPVVVQQHAEESASLRHVRSVLVRAPHVGLLHLGRLDERIAAHLDGLAVAGDYGTKLCVAALERPGCGEVFALAVRALESRNEALLEHVLALAPALPDAARGVVSALGWVSAADLQGTVRLLLASAEPVRRAFGLAACRMHRVDPGRALQDGLTATPPDVRAAALRAAGELGRVDLLDPARQAMADEHPDVMHQAAVAACLLGDRQHSLRLLAQAAMQPTAQGDHALALVLAASANDAAGAIARRISTLAQEQPANMAWQRRRLRALGLLGDARFVPWLIERTAEPELARLSGEAFCWITGADLARMDLETLQAPALPEHPSDDPDDDDVSLDEDDSLPWPDAVKVQAWWAKQTAMHAAVAAGQRLFEGEAPSAAVAQRVLREGTQRRRARAALLACVLRPGSNLFPIAAPTRRQQRWLAASE
jgi:uncharacterized protein (TIGR02270 family)